MAMNSKSGNRVLTLWLLLHRTADVLARCEDSVFGEYGLTTEQFTVLAAVKGSGSPLRPVDLASLMERSPNSVSMLVDRMVKAGLVRRTRDRKDRRAVKVTLTSKGENALGPAVPAGWELVKKILSPLSEKEQQALASLLERVKCECLGHLDPGVDIREIRRKSVTHRPDLYEQFDKNLLASGSKPKRQAVRRKRAVR
jgi:DNA-binding MarR family transcriptional regulator